MQTAYGKIISSIICALLFGCQADRIERGTSTENECYDTAAAFIKAFAPEYVVKSISPRAEGGCSVLADLDTDPLPLDSHLIFVVYPDGRIQVPMLILDDIPAAVRERFGVTALGT